MTILWMLAAFIAGALAGFGLAFAFKIFQIRSSRQIAEELCEDMGENLKAAFGKISLDALSQSTDQFQKLAKAEFKSQRDLGTQELENKKELIDQQLDGMTEELKKVSDLVNELEKDRQDKFGQLTNALVNTNKQTSDLLNTTNILREALANSRARGQWGERMAEDVLRLAGFVENVNYLKQRAIEGIGSKPDITFLLPKDLKLNMDVKFPYDNYMRHLSATSDIEKDRFKADFFKDVKLKLKEVTARDYINPEQNTVDSVLLFIPNEQIYAFIHEQDSAILDDGIRQGVVFCSPLTLFAVLAVIRKAVDNFSLEQTSNEILSLLGDFKKQWGEFLGKLELVGKRIGDAQKEYEALTTTRRRQLERPLNRIEDLRMQRGLPIEANYETTLPDKRGDDADTPAL